MKSVVEALQRLYPKQLADSSWDNTGLLLDTAATAPTKTSERTDPRVLLTIDLTTDVCDEAIAMNSDLVIAYHPFIFRGLKQISSQNPQQLSLLKLAQAGISVYSPHTAVDASKVGVNDWLADGITGSRANELSRSTVQPCAHGLEGHEEAGFGRLVSLKDPVPLPHLVRLVKEHLDLQTVQLALAERHTTDPVQTIALCAGSGGSVLQGSNADVWVTGELGHHEMLYLREIGTTVIVCGHSNTERGFLPVLKNQLQDELAKEGVKPRIRVSRTDKDPLQYV